MEESRRVRMTKKLIADAFLELLDEAPAKKLNIADVCRRADVNRSTFYTYYTDLSALLKDIEDDTIAHIPVVDELPQRDSDNSEFLSKLVDFFTYVRQNERLFRILIVKSDSSSFNRRLVNEIMQKYVRAGDDRDARLVQYGYIYVVSGVIGMLREWITNDFPLNVKSFSRLVLETSIRAYDIADVKLD